MKVLFLSHSLEGSSWSEISHNMIRSLSIYTDVVARPIVIHGQGSLPEDLRRVYENSLDDVTHCIQYTLPIHMQKGHVPCVGYFVQESDSVKYIGWQDHLNQMDQVWVPLHLMMKEKYKYIPHPFDIRDFNKQYPQPVIPELDGKYIFYTIANFSRRKRLAALLEGFHLAFNKNDNVGLIIKSNVDREIYELNEKVKQELRITRSKYIDPLIINQSLSYEEIMGLHQRCDCYVNTAFGEGFEISAFRAMGHGNRTIVPDYLDYLDNSILIPTQKVPCFGADQPVEDIYSGRENWYSVSPLDVSKAMREVYEKYKPGTKFNNSKIKGFSYENVGQKMHTLLEKL